MIYKKFIITFALIFTMIILFEAKPIFASEIDLISIEDARNSTNDNLVINADLTNNLRDSNANGLTYENGVFNMTYTGSWLRAMNIYSGPMLNTQYVSLNDSKTDTSQLDCYYSATLNWENAKSMRTLGLVLGQANIKETQEKVYVSCVLVPYEKSISFYYYKQANGQGDQNYFISASKVALFEGFDYEFEVLKNQEGISVYINSKLITTLKEFSNSPDYSTSSEVGTVDLTSMIPAPGVCFMDINASISNYTFKYLNEGTYSIYSDRCVDLDYAREYSSQNIYDIAEVKVSANKRDPEMNGLSMNDNIVKMEYTGGWLRATNIFTNSYFESQNLIINNEEVSTKGINSYYKAKFKVENMESDRILGLVFAKGEVLGENVYLSANICPGSNYVSLYFSTSKPYDFQYNISADFVIKQNEEYVFEILMVDGAVQLYIDGIKYLDVKEYDVTALFSNVTTTISISDFSPCFGVNFMDINAEMYDFEMKYLVQYDEIKIYVEPTYPQKDKNYEINTENVEINTDNFKLEDYFNTNAEVLDDNNGSETNISSGCTGTGCGGSIISSLFGVLAIAGSVIIIKKKKE